MNRQNLLRGCFAALLAATGSSTASAVSLQTIVSPIYQVGTASSVNLGHTVYASTNFNRLTAGGTFMATCNNAAVLPVMGQRTLSADNVTGGLSLYVTIPEQHPARVNMPGYYDAASRGVPLTCAYNWTSRALEGGYSVGAGGVTFPIGNGERTDGGTQIFTMSVPSPGQEITKPICTP